ncbi:MAG: hypothetical protein ACE15C_13275 [Phycisphaerae bacterium]
MIRRFAAVQAALAICILSPLVVPSAIAEGPQFGAAESQPSPARPVGWRGDGTGKYPGANPPLHWGRSLRQLSYLKCASAVPKDGGAKDAKAASGGYFTEWLIGWPVKCEGPAEAVKAELVPGEATLAPNAGDKLAGGAWQMVKAEGALVDLWKVLGDMTKEQAAYAQACLHSDKPVKIWLSFKCGLGGTLWFNGKQIHSVAQGYPGGQPATLEVELKQGWNRFLFKVVPYVTKAEDFVKGCYITCEFWPSEAPRDFDEKNIAWIAPMPGLSQAMPIVVGDNVFTTAHPYNLVCVDKKTGKILWIRPNSPYDAATADERKAKPEVFAKLDALAAKRDAYYSDFAAGKLPSAPAVRDETDLEAQIDKLMLEVDAR